MIEPIGKENTFGNRLRRAVICQQFIAETRAAARPWAESNFSRFMAGNQTLVIARCKILRSSGIFLSGDRGRLRFGTFRFATHVEVHRGCNDQRQDHRNQHATNHCDSEWLQHLRART